MAGGGVLAGCTDDDAPPPTSGTPPPSTSAPPRTTPTSEAPTSPPTSEPPTTPTSIDPLSGIVSVAVHPAIGVARVGNSADSFFFGPELPGSLPIAPGGFKDATGAIARQAARFRIFGYDAGGAVLQEITAADADITWTVSVANKKAAWYNFNRAMDLPVAVAVKRRNPDVAGVDRERLVVASGERSISGPAAAPVALDAGRFLDEPVPLGELLTDEFARLVFVPGQGRGYSPGQAPLDIVRQQRRLGRRHVRRPGAGDRDDRRAHAAGGAGMGRRGAAELRTRAPQRPDHRVRLVAPRMGHVRPSRADRS